MLERVYHMIIDQSPLPVTGQNFRINSLSTVCFRQQFGVGNDNLHKDLGELWIVYYKTYSN